MEPRPLRTAAPSAASAEPGRARRVAVLSGTRAEFGLLRRTLSLLAEAPWCRLEVIVAGMHLDPRFGLTAREVEAALPIAARIPMEPPEDSRLGMAASVGRGLERLADALAAFRPPLDLLLVLGDRTEAFAGALAAAYLGIPVAHIHGGDSSGNPVDDFQRDLISRLAGLHLAATARSARRLGAMAVRGAVLVVGAPGLDALVGRAPRPRAAVARALGLERQRWLVVVHHPQPAHPETAAAELEAVLGAAAILARERDAEVVAIHPNNDAGSAAALSALETRGGGERRFASLERELYLDLLAHAELLLGNSSSGIIEGAALGLAAVNVGDRQRGRERDANVVDCEPRVDLILAAARRALADPALRQACAARRSLYGDGCAAERIVAALGSFLGAPPAASAAPPLALAAEDEP